MHAITLNVLPGTLSWTNSPAAVDVHGPDSLSISAGPETDWFADPGSSNLLNNAPVALFAPPDPQWLLSARVTVGFQSTYDAGVLFAYLDDDHWAKLCFEYSPQQEPMVVSVVTRGRSDDCNSVVIAGTTVWLRIHRYADALALHYATDGATWHFVRHFTLGALAGLRIGFAAQSPTGQGCTARFDAIAYRAGTLPDLRSGA